MKPITLESVIYEPYHSEEDGKIVKRKKGLIWFMDYRYIFFLCSVVGICQFVFHEISASDFLISLFIADWNLGQFIFKGLLMTHLIYM